MTTPPYRYDGKLVYEGDYRPYRARCRNKVCGERLSAEDTERRAKLCPSCRRIFRVGWLLGAGLAVGFIGLGRFLFDTWIAGWLS